MQSGTRNIEFFGFIRTLRNSVIFTVNNDNEVTVMDRVRSRHAQAYT